MEIFDFLEDTCQMKHCYEFYRWVFLIDHDIKHAYAVLKYKNKVSPWYLHLKKLFSKKGYIVVVYLNTEGKILEIKP